MHKHSTSKVHVSQDVRVPANISALEAGAKWQEQLPGLNLAEPNEKGIIPGAELPTDRFDPNTVVLTIPMRSKSPAEIERVGLKVLKMTEVKSTFSHQQAKWEIYRGLITPAEERQQELFPEGKLTILARQVETLAARTFHVGKGHFGILGHLRLASPTLQKRGYKYEAVITHTPNNVQRGTLDAEVAEQAADIGSVIRKARAAAVEYSKWTNVRANARPFLYSYQDPGSEKLRMSFAIRIDMEGTSPLGYREEARFLVETKTFTIKREDSLRFYMQQDEQDMHTYGIKGMTTPTQSLKDQQRKYSLKNLPATAKTLKNSLLHAQYEGTKDNQWHDVTPIADGPNAGTMMYDVGTDQAFATLNAKEIMGIFNREKSYGLVPAKKATDGRLNDSDGQAADNAYFSAGWFGNSPTIHTGRGSGGTHGLVPDISDDNDVVRHECHHEVQWLLVPSDEYGPAVFLIWDGAGVQAFKKCKKLSMQGLRGRRMSPTFKRVALEDVAPRGGDYPSQLHEGGADVGAKLALLEVMAEDNELEAAGPDFIRTNPWNIGEYASGDLEDKNGKKMGRLRFLNQVISMKSKTNEPHHDGLISAGAEMEDYVHYTTGREGISITQGVKDSRASYMYLRQASRGGSTKEEDLLRNRLAFDRKNFNGSSVEQIKDSWKKRDITVNELDSAEKTRAHIAMLAR